VQIRQPIVGYLKNIREMVELAIMGVAVKPIETLRKLSIGGLAFAAHHPRAGAHARDVSRRQEPFPWPGTRGGQVTRSALLQPELSGVATFFFGFFTILIVVGGSVLFTCWISQDE
jgi:hypothetical protein